MTQYPDPYQQPPGMPGFNAYYGPPPPNPLAPARRASLMLFVVGALAILAGICAGIVVWFIPLDQLVNEARNSVSAQQLSQLPPGVTLEEVIRIGYTVFAVVGVGFGILLMCLAPFVRRGGRGSTITGIVLFFVLGAFCLFNLLSVFAQFANGATPAAVGGLLMVAVIGGVVVLALVLLFQAVRVSGYAALHQRQAQAQAMYYQQIQQPPPPPGGYGQGYGYGYGAVPPPPQAPLPPLQGQVPPPPPPEGSQGDPQA